MDVVLNRVDEIIILYCLQRENMDQIADINIEVFTKRTHEDIVILATHAHSPIHTASISVDAGRTFLDAPIQWDDGAVPFYTCATQRTTGADIIVGGLTRLAGGLPNHTYSQIFVLTGATIAREIVFSKYDWLELNQPMRMDQDSMSKDRMALLADPLYDDLFYVT